MYKRVLFLLWLAIIVVSPLSPQAHAEDPALPTGWHQLNVPAKWDKQDNGKWKDFDGVAWYRCFVKIPQSWAGSELEFYIPNADDRADLYINGKLIGENLKRAMYKIPAGIAKAGQWNIIAVRIVDNGGQGGISGQGPVIYGNRQAISLKGKWQFQIGDDNSLSTWNPAEERPAAVSYDRAVPARDEPRIIKTVRVNNGDVPVNTPESARRMIADLTNTYGDKYKGAEFIAELDRIEKIQSKDAAANALDELIRKATLANPLLDFDKLLVVRRTREANRGLNSHTSDTIKRTGWDNEISVLSNLRGEVNAKTVYRHRDKSVIKHLDLNFSGDKVMFSGLGENGMWAVLEVGIDGTGIKELTPADQKDVQWFDSCYLPEDGKIIVCSTAGMQGLPCENGGKPMVNMYRVDVDTKKVRQLTFEQDSDWHPRVMHDGRIMYLRWEYTDTPHYYSRYMFQMNPDGTGQREYWGSGSYFPTAYVWARPIPNQTSMMIGIASGHHAKSETGRLIIINPSLARKYPMRYRPDDIIWGPENTNIHILPDVLGAEKTGCVQEIPGWERDVVGNVYDNQGGNQEYTFGTPWPLSDKYFLVSMKKGKKWVLALVDVFDNMTVIYEDEKYSIFEPIPLVSRKKPPVLADRVIPGTDSVIFCTDIYLGPGLKGIERGKVKSLRVLAYHYAYMQNGGHESCGLETSWDIKRILGTVPVEKDGSFSFNAPANTPLAIQPLDEDGAALALMRSWMTSMPGEMVSCNGCHESQNEVTINKPTIAGRRPPDDIKPWHGPARPFSYEMEVQPVLEKYCMSCHNENDRKGAISFQKTNPDEWKKDKSYLNLVAFTRKPGPESDLDMYNPMEWHVSTSPLVQMLRKGHHGVNLDKKAWSTIYTWIDLNAPHRGRWNDLAREKRRCELEKLYTAGVANPEEEFRKAKEIFAKTNITPVAPTKIKKPKPDGLKVEKSAKYTKSDIFLNLPDDTKIKLVSIPAGNFVMGSQKGYQDARPRAIVNINKPFSMSECEITNRQYELFDPKHDTRYLDENGKDHSVPGYIANHPDQPVARISWQDAMRFCKWLSEKTGKKVTLPTESQWEYASRAGSDQQFFYGDKDTDFSTWANLADASRRRTYVSWDGGSKVHIRRNYPADYLYPLRDDRFTDKWFVVDRVKQYEPNPWGLYDIVGNVSEWTRSDYQPYPYAEDGRNAGDLKTKKVARGGSWNDRPKTAGSAIRFPYESYQKVYNVGFRVIIEDGDHNK